MSQTLTYVIGQDRRPHVDNVQDFKVNFDGSNTNWVQARQYERSMRQVFVNIKNEDGTPLDLTGCNVWFEGLLPKNSAGDFRVIDDKGYVALDPTAGRFRFDMPGHAFTVAGSYRQAFFRILKDGNSITTLEFDLDVLADKVIDGLVPRTYISPVEELINEIETKYQDSTDKLTKMTSDFVDQFTQSMNTLKALGVTVQNGLDALEAKIKQDGLFTQAEADAFKQEVAGILANAATSKIRGNKKYSTLSERLDDDEQHQIYAYDSINEMLADDSLNDGMIVQTFNHNANDHICQKFMISNQQPSNKLFIKLSNGNYAVEMTKNRPFAPKIVAQPEMFIVNNDLEKMKQYIDGRIYTGYESFVVDVHLNYGNGGFTTSEDLSKLLEVFQYAKNQGYSITALKIHYTGAFDDKSVPAYCSYITGTVIPALKGLGFDKVCVLNERQETVTPLSSTYIPQFMGLITSIKELGYKVGISYENDSHITLGYSYQHGLMESLDWIGCNLYPTVGAYGELTGVDDVKSAFDDAMDSLYMVQQLGKPILITEIGIRPYAQYFGSPSNYGYDNSIDGDYTVFTRYFEGAFKSKIRSVASEIWDWHAYDNEHIPALAQLIRQARGVI
ncbi:BppU family phage baseplate upper protein [Limosilactobacillus reuteri]|uniref:BppU family phage baseplate upper protein n=1 Tax=Limosilactobacillus reuteri TaxID=1598 RepID=UPI003F6840A4